MIGSWTSPTFTGPSASARPGPLPGPRRRHRRRPRPDRAHRRAAAGQAPAQPRAGRGPLRGRPRHRGGRLPAPGRRRTGRAVERTVLARRTQTNEAGRCASLLPVLAQVEGPLALIEVGASAGLCLQPDRYRYAYDARPPFGPGPVTLTCATEGDPPLPDAVPDDRLAGRDRPGPRRRHRPRTSAAGSNASSGPARTPAATASGPPSPIAAHDPPRLVEGDAAAALPGLVAEATRARHGRRLPLGDAAVPDPRGPRPLRGPGDRPRRAVDLQRGHSRACLDSASRRATGWPSSPPSTASRRPSPIRTAPGCAGSRDRTRPCAVPSAAPRSAPAVPPAARCRPGSRSPPRAGAGPPRSRPVRGSPPTRPPPATRPAV